LAKYTYERISGSRVEHTRVIACRDAAVAECLCDDKGLLGADDVPTRPEQTIAEITAVVKKARRLT